MEWRHCECLYVTLTYIFKVTLLECYYLENGESRRKMLNYDFL